VPYLWRLAFHGAVVTNGAAWEQALLLSLHGATTPVA